MRGLKFACWRGSSRAGLVLDMDISRKGVVTDNIIRIRIRTRTQILHRHGKFPENMDACCLALLSGISRCQETWCSSVLIVKKCLVLGKEAICIRRYLAQQYLGDLVSVGLDRYVPGIAIHDHII